MRATIEYTPCSTGQQYCITFPGSSKETAHTLSSSGLILYLKKRFYPFQYCHFHANTGCLQVMVYTTLQLMLLNRGIQYCPCCRIAVIDLEICGSCGDKSLREVK